MAQNKSIGTQIENGFKKMTIVEFILLMLGIVGSMVYIGAISGTVFGYDMTQVVHTFGANTDITAAFAVATASLVLGYGYNVSQGKGGWYPNETEAIGLLLAGGVHLLAFLNQATFDFFNQSATYQAIFTGASVVGMALVASQRYMAR